jgi:hypothetical protein
MRKLVLPAALAVALLAPSGANAFFATHFKVISHTVSGHQTARGFAFKDNLLDPANPSNSVGRDRGHCDFNRTHRSLFCHATVYLNGELGGAGSFTVGGRLSDGDNRLSVNGGTGDFNGVAGKLTLHEKAGPANDDVLEFSLVR